MTDDAKLRARAERAWDKYANGGDVSLAPVATFLMVITAEFAAVAAEARREALMEAAYIATGHSRERIEEHIRALADEEREK